MWGGIGRKGYDDRVFRARAGTPDLQHGCISVWVFWTRSRAGVEVKNPGRRLGGGGTGVAEILTGLGGSRDQTKPYNIHS